MKIILPTTILLLAILLQSCDCTQYVAGSVVDRETGAPVSGAEVYKVKKESDNSLSNEKGEYEVRSISGGLFSCPRMKIRVEKEGYQALQQKGGGEIQLKKVKTE